MDGNRAHRVIDLHHPVEESHRHRHQDAADDADHRCPEGIHRVAPRRDAHQAGQGRVEGHGNIRLAVADPGKGHGGDRCQGRRQVRVEEHQSCGGDQLVAVHAHRGGAVESEPAEPKDKHPQRRQAQVVPQDRPGLSVGTVLPDPGPENLRADQGAHPAYHMHRRGSGKVMESHFRQPATAPDPVAAHRIDEKGDGRGVEAVGGEPGPLRHGAGYDGRRGGAEHRLEDGKGPQRHPFRQHRAVFLHDEGINPSEQRRARSEHDPEARQPVQRRADAKVHQVLHQDIARVLCPGKSGFTHGKSRLHEENQCRPQQHPYRVCRRVHHSAHFRFRNNKKRRRGFNAPSRLFMRRIVYCIHSPVKGLSAKYI